MKKTLGRGLGALIPGADSNDDFSAILGTAVAEKKIFDIEHTPKEVEKPASDGIATLKISDIEPCRTQPRKTFDEDALESLAQSIKIHGIIQPIIVRPIEPAGRYEIIAGERRWRASRMAGLREVPVVIRMLDNENIMELALIENLQRVDLNPIDEALGYQTLINKYSCTQEQISERIGKSRSAIANSLRLLTLPQPIKELVETGDITNGHARAITVLNAEQQKEVAEKIIRHDLSVRATESLVKSILHEKKKKKSSSSVGGEIKVYLESVEKKFANKLGTKVSITQGKKKNKIEIEYYTNRDLERIMKVLAE